MKFGFIGAGNMAGAIIKGMTIATKSFDGKDILINSKTMASAQKLAEVCGASAASAEEAASCDILVLAVKPHVLASVLPSLKQIIKNKKPLVVSIAAGKTLSYLEELLPAETPIVRIMPNINAKIGAATSGMCKNKYVTPEGEALVRQIFETIGSVIAVDESQFSIFTVLAGSAPAFAYLYMDTLARAAVKAGMTKQQALTIAAAAVEGSARMILESNEHPMALVDQVCSPGGTTIEGIAMLQKRGFEATLTDAFDAVLEKDLHIGKKI